MFSAFPLPCFSGGFLYFSLVFRLILLCFSFSYSYSGVKQLGAHLAIDYKQCKDFSKEVKSFTKGKGANVILDHIGAAYLAKNINSLA